MKNTSSTTAVFAKPLLVCAIATGAIATPALAQERAGILEEIVVTAEHREASLQETQISISAFAGDTLTDLGISSGLDLSQYVPNLTAQPTTPLPVAIPASTWRLTRTMPWPSTGRRPTPWPSAGK